MKKKICIAIMTLASFSFLGVSGAYAASHNNVDNPGITPDSPFYFLDQAGEWIQNIFATSNNAKAEAALEHATERIAELKIMHAEGILDSGQLKELSEKYKELIIEYKDVSGDVSEKTESEKRKQFDEALEKHVDVLDDIFEDDDFSSDIQGVLENAEENEDDIVEQEVEENDDESLEYFQNKAQRKIANAEAKIAKAHTFLLNNPSEEAQAQLNRAELFLAESIEAFDYESYVVAYGLAKQAKTIAEKIRFPEKGEELIDTISEKGTEEVLKAEEKIAKATALLDSADLTDVERAELEASIDEAIARLAQSEAALDNDEFYAGHILASYAKKIASKVTDTLEGENDGNLNNGLDEVGVDIETIVENKIARARRDLNEVLSLINASGDGEMKVAAQTQYNRALSLLNESKGYANAKEYILALMFAKDAREVASKIDDVLGGEDIVTDEKAGQEEQKEEKEREKEKIKIKKSIKDEKDGKDSGGSFEDEKQGVEQEVKEKKAEIKKKEEAMKKEIEDEIDNSSPKNDNEEESSEEDISSLLDDSTVEEDPEDDGTSEEDSDISGSSEDNEDEGSGESEK